MPPTCLNFGFAVKRQQSLHSRHVGHAAHRDDPFYELFTLDGPLTQTRDAHMQFSPQQPRLFTRMRVDLHADVFLPTEVLQARVV